MELLRNKKIIQFLSSQSFFEDISDSTSEFSKLNYVSLFEERETRNLQGIQLRIAEFHNTISHFLRILPIIQRKDNISINSLKSRYNKFIKNISSEATQGDNDNTRIFLDVTFTITQNTMTGIPRVVTEIARQGLKHGVTPVILYEGNAYKYDHVSDRFDIVIFQKSDIFIHPDAGWNYLNDLLKTLEILKINGGESVFILYDIIPLIYEQLSDSTHVLAFQNWVNLTIEKCDYALCISKSVADEYLVLLNNYKLNTSTIKSIGWNHLGSDFYSCTADTVSVQIQDATKSKRPFFLSVGTIEPRKAYSICIDAIEKLWANGSDASFIIVGKYGWSQSGIKHRILNHTEYGHRLFWFESASDADLQYLYEKALALISSSLCEGFGLPLIEAALYGLPAIVSDIPVFREIGGNSTKFFEVTNSDDLVSQMIAALSAPKIRSDIEVLRWKDAVNSMLEIIKDRNYQYDLQDINFSREL